LRSLCKEPYRSEENLVVIPLPTLDSWITCATARLIEENGRPLAEAIGTIPNRVRAPAEDFAFAAQPHRLRPGSAGWPSLYRYEGMIGAAAKVRWRSMRDARSATA
jgi:hypothetical protein